jgi:hypothetical protein
MPLRPVLRLISDDLNIRACTLCAWIFESCERNQVMNMRLNRILLPLLSVLVIGCAASVVAQDAMPMGSTPSAGQAPNVAMTHTPGVASMVNMHGMHTMPATVTTADPKTGIVDVTSNGMALKVHFQPESMANLKAGDKIGLYMAYSQATVVQ